MLNPDIVVCLSGGVVQAVYARGQDQSVVIVDWDAYVEDADLPEVVVIDRDGQSQAAFVGKLQSDSFDSLPGSDADLAITAANLKRH